MSVSRRTHQACSYIRGAVVQREFLELELLPLLMVIINPCERLNRLLSFLVLDLNSLGRMETREPAASLRQNFLSFSPPFPI